MKSNHVLEALTDEEINQISGAAAPDPKPMDRHGNTTTMEDYMNRQLKALQTGDSRWVFGSTDSSGIEWLTLD